MTRGCMLTKVMAPVTWYKTGTQWTCCHGIGMFSSNLSTACGIEVDALVMTELAL